MRGGIEGVGIAIHKQKQTHRFVGIYGCRMLWQEKNKIMAERLIYIIQPKDLKDRGFLHRNINDIDLSHVIYRVQETEIQPILGGVLYKRILNDIKELLDNNTPIQSDYLELINDYIIPCMIPYCEERAIMHLNNNMKAAGVGTNVDANLRIAEIKERKNLQEYVLRDAIFYRNKLIDFLIFKKLPEYLECDPIEVKPNDKKNNSSNKILFIKGGIW
jgi:hypothetical protein